MSEHPATKGQPAICVKCRDLGWFWDYYDREHADIGHAYVYVRKGECPRCEAGVFWRREVEAARAAYSARLAAQREKALEEQAEKKYNPWKRTR